MKKLVFMSLVLALSLGAGCAKNVHKDWFAIDGSRADATVKVAMTWNPQTEIPQGEREQADKLAEEKCKVWGYTGAEMFGGINQRCTQYVNGFGGMTCAQMQAEITYQCLGNPGQSQPQPVGKAIKP